MTTVVIGIGSNDNPEQNIRQGMGLLRQHYRVEQVSSFYETPPVGHDGVTYWNGVVVIETTQKFTQIKATLVLIEDACGRVRLDTSGNKSTVVALDFDILLYGQDSLTYDHKHQIPHPDIAHFAHVAVPLAELLPDAMHPITNESFATIAHKFSNETMQIIADFKP